VTQLVEYVILGIPIGCVFALLAVGLVLTYKASGVFNLAFGAQAFVSAAVFYDMRSRHELPLWLAFFVSVVLVGPLLGLVLYQALFRHLRTASGIARLVTSLGLLVAIPEMVKLWFGQSPAYNPPGVHPDADRIYRFGDFALDSDQAATIVITLVAVGALTALFRWSALGLRMRAVVESPRMAELNGVDAERVSSAAWMLSSLFAGLAGVLLAPLFAQVDANNFFVLLIAAIAAAAFAGLTSIPMALLGGLLLGILQQVLAGYLPRDSVLSSGLRPSLPFVVLLVLLVFWPLLRRSRDEGDPLAGVDPPPPALAAAERSERMTTFTHAFAVVVIVGGIGLALFGLNDFWLLLVTQAVIYGVIFLSITVMTGMGGQVSLCQGAFAAVGAFTTAQLVDAFGLPVLTTILLGTLLAAVVGAVVALPALRLDGIYLSLATLAFALMFESVLVPMEWVSGTGIPTRVPRPLVGPVDFASDKAFFLLCVGVLALASVAVLLIKRGSTGHFLDALRGSEVAATSVGINPARARVVAFAISAGLAGLGGGLLATQQGLAQPRSFIYFFGLFWVVLVVTLGARSVQAAIIAGFSLMLFPEILDRIGIAQSWTYILFGLGAITYAKHPEGIIEHQTRRSLARTERLIARLRGGQGSTSAPSGDEVGATTSATPAGAHAAVAEAQP
jgi:ABC-type branched-subunit amino acid transport system permease subunit